MSARVGVLLDGMDKEAETAVCDVLEERHAQYSQWGEQNHDAYRWLAILSEEVGEMAQCALHNEFGGKHRDRIMEEAVHVAAVALAIVECGLRNKW